MRRSELWQSGLAGMLLLCGAAVGQEKPLPKADQTGMRTPLTSPSWQEKIRLSKEVYIDKCKGAWAGQMIGVVFGAPYEFRAVGNTIEEPLHDWKPEMVEGTIGQDDLYVEMNFLMALEKHGLDITFEQAGREFADTKFDLAHANHHGRENCRQGIMPPWSGHPMYNRHADDIDFQIEADMFGIICPGLPRESNRLGWVFGHIMNYGDGVYGGLFVAGMYAAAYFENSNIEKVVQAGLACIPPESRYARCIEDVLRGYRRNPKDWRATWRLIEERWNDDQDCEQGSALSIDAHINGAYIAIGLLYGEGDFFKTIEISTRCGQDADCNPSSAAGILGCMIGYNAIGEKYTGGIAKIADTPFAHADYSFNTLIPACQQMTERIILRAGGCITNDAYWIPQQLPLAARLEQWTNQQVELQNGIQPHHVQWWNPAWHVIRCGHSMCPGYYPKYHGRERVISLHSVSLAEPVVLVSTQHVPDKPAAELSIDVSSSKGGANRMKVFADNKLLKEVDVETDGKFVTETVDLSAYAGRTIEVRIEAVAKHRLGEYIVFDKIAIK